MGPPGHQLNIATGNAILLMLYLLAGLMIAFGIGAFTLVRRAKRHARENVGAVPTDPHLDAMLSTLARGGDMRPYLEGSSAGQGRTKGCGNSN